MPSKRDIRLIINDAETGQNIADQVILDTNLDPTRWQELPEFLNQAGRIINVSREQMLNNTFRLDIDRSTQ